MYATTLGFLILTISHINKKGYNTKRKALTISKKKNKKNKILVKNPN